HGFSSYIHDRLDGLIAESLEPDEEPWGATADLEQQVFPEFFAQYHQHLRYIWMNPKVDISEVPNLPGNSERFRLVAPLHTRATPTYSVILNRSRRHWLARRSQTPLSRRSRPVTDGEIATRSSFIRVEKRTCTRWRMC